MTKTTRYDLMSPKSKAQIDRVLKLLDKNIVLGIPLDKPRQAPKTWWWKLLVWFLDAPIRYGWMLRWETSVLERLRLRPRSIVLVKRELDRRLMALRHEKADMTKRAEVAYADDQRYAGFVAQGDAGSLVEVRLPGDKKMTGHVTNVGLDTVLVVEELTGEETAHSWFNVRRIRTGKAHDVPAPAPTWDPSGELKR